MVGLFASEEMHQKFLSHDKTLSFSDWNEFLSRKANENDSIDNIGKETRKKGSVPIASDSISFSCSERIFLLLPTNLLVQPYFLPFAEKEKALS